MKINVYLTIDTEHSMGGAWANPELRPVPTDRHIYCRIGGKDHGIGWICDELGRHGFAATFFCEMFSSLIFGKDDTRNWCQYLLDRGQDVQLHTHLNYYYYARRGEMNGREPPRTDDLANMPAAVRPKLLEQACELFHYATGRNPTAYRAGNWRMDRDFLADLANVGIALDSSFNPTMPGGRSFPGDNLKRNTFQKIGAMWELPLSVVQQSLPEPNLVGGIRPFDLVSLSSWEMRKALDEAHKAQMPHVVAVMHSFSGVKTKDVQYREMKPDRVVRNRLRNLMDYLAADPDRFKVSTCGELTSQLDNAQTTEAGAPPHLGFVHPLARKVVQVVNSFYWT